MTRKQTVEKQWVFQATYRWKDGDNYYISGVYNSPRPTTLQKVLAIAKQFHPKAVAVEVTIGPDVANRWNKGNYTVTADR